MFYIKTYNKISAIGLNEFDGSLYTCGDDVAEPVGAIVSSAALHETVFPKSLLAIARAGAETNNIPVDRCAEEGIVVFYTPGAHANAVKELVLAGLLMCSRRVVPAIRWVESLKGKGAEVGKTVEKGKGAFVGPEIKGKSLGIIGLGAIGALVANSANALGMKVYGYDPYLSVSSAWNITHNAVRVIDIDDIFTKCNYITVHVPLSAETKELINKDTLAKMKDGVRILNFAHDELVNSADMLAALDEGKVAAYVTDFPSDDLIGADGVIAIPHLGAATPESEDNCAKMAADELIDFLETGNIVNSVNLPNISMPRTGAARICLIHRNVPAVINKITGIISDVNINISNMLNKSKADYAYTMLDLDEKDRSKVEKIADAISEMSDVIRVRVIE